ncbi:hypothetical protein Tco_0996577 [Tanacetum coccineum]
MGIGINLREVKCAARLGRCSTFTTPFNYLGVKVGEVMSRIYSWGEVWPFFSQKPSLWSRFIKAIYGDKGSFDNVVVPHHRSYWLDNIHVLLSLNNKGIDVMAFIKKKVGNGEGSKFWDDVWLGDLALKAQYPRLYALELHKDISVAEKKIDYSLALSFRRPPRGWAEKEQYSYLLSRVDEVSLPCMLDRWVWTFDSSGEFSVKSISHPYRRYVSSKGVCRWNILRITSFLAPWLGKRLVRDVMEFMAL